jgi:putative peptidoglycan lipid II flippase
MQEQARQYRDMAKTASWTMVSRILGLVRDQLTAAVFGASAMGAAFIFAFQIPNLFRRLLGEGALTAAIVPVLARKTAQDGKPAAFRFLNHILRRILPWMVGLTLISIGGAILWIFFRPQDTYVATLTAVCMPYMPIICVAALFTSAVNLSGRFGLAEIASSLLNLSMIIGLGFFGENLASTDFGKAIWLCIGALVGGMLQLLIPLRGLYQEGWRWGSETTDEAAWQTLRTAFIPAALGAGIQQINFLVSRSLAFKSSDAGLTFYYLANRIVELPIGLFSASIAVVMFPALAQAYAAGDQPALARNYARGMRLILAINVGAALGLMALAYPIVQLLFQFGKFSQENCQATGELLAIFAIAMPFYAMISMVTRALNVAGLTQATLRAAIHALGVNAVFSILALWLGYGIIGLATANAISTIWQYFILRRYLRKKSPEFLSESLWKPTVQVLIGSLIMALITFQVYSLLHRLMVHHVNEKINLLVSMGVAGILGMAFYAIYLDVLKYPERDLLRGYLNKVLKPFGYQFKP